MVEHGMETAPGLGRLELIRIAESVAHEKGIGIDDVIVAMEQAIQTAARRKYGQEHRDRRRARPQDRRHRPLPRARGG